MGNISMKLHDGSVRPFLANGIILLASLVMSLTLVEAVIRMKIRLPPSRPLPQVRYDPHPVRRFALRPKQEAYTYDAVVQIDQHGFRRNGGPLRLQPRIRLFALGDSFTFGMGVSDGETWPARLEAILTLQIAGGVQVINGGTVSYGIFQELDLFREQGISMRPRVLIHGLYWNDFMSNHPLRPDDPPVLTSEGYFVWDDPSPPERPLLRAARWVVNHSALVFTIKNAIRGMLARETGVGAYEESYHRLIAGTINSTEWKSVEGSYETLKELGNKHGFVLYVVILPVLGIIELPEPSQHPYPRYVRGILNRQDIPYVDGFTIWEERGLGSEMFLPHTRHLNAAGYEVIAHALARALRKEEQLRELFER